MSTNKFVALTLELSERSSDDVNLAQHVLVMMRTYKLAVRVLHAIHVYICGPQIIKTLDCNVTPEYIHIHTHTYPHTQTHMHTHMYRHQNIPLDIISFAITVSRSAVQDREQAGVLAMKRSFCDPSTVSGVSRRCPCPRWPQTPVVP